MLLDLSPLYRYPDYRYLFIGQLISVFGNMITIVALPYQIYSLTHSTMAVGLMGIIELVPLFITAILGGLFADSINRKKLLIYSELLITVILGFLAYNASLAEPQLWVIYLSAGLISALTGFHRPALQSFGPSLVKKEDIPAYSALNSFRAILGTLAGPAIGGFCIVLFGTVIAYLIDMATFAISIFAIMQIKRFPILDKKSMNLKSVKEGFRYAMSRQELIGTYLIDFIAMACSAPVALYPAVAEHLGRMDLIGLFYSAPAVGALAATLLSGWIKKINRQGMGIAIAASCWGIGIIGFGSVDNVWIALTLLAVAGSGNSVSSILRFTIWNQTIPNHLRGRLAGIEMIGYSSGPLIGNTQAGIMAVLLGVHGAIMMGGTLCVAGIILCTRLLPKFRDYSASQLEIEKTNHDAVEKPELIPQV